MQKKVNAELEKIFQTATKKGINLIPIIDFLTSWYEPNETVELIADLEHRYCYLCFGEADIDVFREDARSHIVFLNLFKERLVDAVQVVKN